MKTQDKYLVRGGNNPRGPFTVAQLRQRFDQGFITLDAECWRDGLKAWVPIATVLKPRTGQTAGRASLVETSNTTPPPLSQAIQQPPSASDGHAAGMLVAFTVGMLLFAVTPIFAAFYPVGAALSFFVGLLVNLLTLISLRSSLAPVKQAMLTILLGKPWLRAFLAGTASLFMLGAGIFCMFIAKSEGLGVKARLVFIVGGGICFAWSFELAFLAFGSGYFVSAFRRYAGLE